MGRRKAGPGAALRGLRRWFWAIGIFSVFANLLLLAGPLYMLQVYDRVLSSRSEATLVALTVLLAVLFGVMGLLEHVRGRLAARVGAIVQERLDEPVFRAGLERSVAAGEGSRPTSSLRDLEAVRSFLSSPMLFAIFDAPFVPLFIALLFVFHPLLGWAGVAGALVIVGFTVATQVATKRREAEAHEAVLEGDSYAETMRQEAETVRALGMTGTALARWRAMRRRGLAAQLGSADHVGVYAASSKTFRMFLQSAILGLGAYLVIHDQMTAGGIIAASVMLGRALAPIEGAIAGWPGAQRARAGWRRLGELLVSPREAPMPLPRPVADLEVFQASVIPPGQAKPSLKGLTFAIGPGEALGVIGASASGKSTLARLVTGIWKPVAGAVRLGGATLDQYDAETLGRLIGYLPQDVVLFDGTVAENIARLDLSCDPNEVVRAARQAGAHEMILRLPQGYATRVSAGGAGLSGGQRQRIGLARALYGDPVLVVLDEPNSALDADGSDALNEAVRGMKEEGKAVIIMSHRPAGIAECELILVIADGIGRAFGPRDEVLREHVRNHAQIAPPAPAAPQIAEAQA